MSVNNADVRRRPSTRRRAAGTSSWATSASLAAGDGGRDYWLARDSALLIRGGANYAYEQINAELTAWAKTAATAEVEVSVIGCVVESEHEDPCLATIEFRGEAAQKMMADDAPEAALLVAAARTAVSKGAKPDPRASRRSRRTQGRVLVPELVSTWKAALGYRARALPNLEQRAYVYDSSVPSVRHTRFAGWRPGDFTFTFTPWYDDPLG